MALVDTLLRSLAPRLSAMNIAPPAARLLRPARSQAASEAVESHRRAAADAVSAIARGEATGRQQLAAVAEEALAAMRSRSWELAAQAGPVAALMARMDRAFLDPAAQEKMDDPDFDEALRRRAVASLDRFNEGVGSYALFARVLDEQLPDDGDVLDLAAGHAGFALWLARRARATGRALRVTATDLRDSYLDLGRERARAEGLPLHLRVQDALDLSNVERGTFDVVLCTQAVHHFPAGLVAVLAEEASRVAGRAVVLVDGCRTALLAVVVAGVVGAGFRDATFAHDSFASFRRFFVPEELELLVRLGAGDRPVHADFHAPGHCVVVVRTQA